MRGERKIFCMIMVGILLTGTFLFFPTGVLAPSTPKAVYGLVDPNTTTGVIAYPGNSTFYLMNWRENGTDTGPMVTSGGVEYFNMDIEDNITNWEVGDIGVVIVDIESGSYPGGDRAGYVAYTTKILTDSDDIFPTVELQKIPTPTQTVNGTGFINMSWAALPDPSGLIAGYKIYRSETNASDGDWALWGGSVNAPLTDLWFNDTTSVVAGVTYYYSVKVCFVGYQTNNPGNVDNFQNKYWGEGSGNMTSPGAPPTVDYILIMDLPGGVGSEIPDMTGGNSIGVGITITGYAVAYSNTLGFLWDVSVTWTIIQVPPENATSAPGTGTWSDFWSGWNGGSVVWQADDGAMHIDVVNITINPPVVNYIEIVDTPGTGTNLINGGAVDVGYTITGWAAGFNYTIGYFGDVSVTWNVNNFFGANAQTSPALGTSSMFNASSPDGMADWVADYNSGQAQDTVSFTINPPNVDFILIVDAPGGAGNEIMDKSIGVNTIVNGWAAAYNDSVGYLYDVSALWSVNNVGAAAVTNPGTGINSTFDAKPNSGTATWIAEFGLINDTVVFDVLIPTVDYIEIVYSQGTGTNPISLTITVGVGVTITGYAAAFNNTVGYLYDMSVNWSADPSGLENATTTPLMNSDWSDFYSGWIGGTVYWNATDGYGHSYSIVVTIDPPVVNYIMIVDTMGTGTAVILDQNIEVGMPMTGYAAMFNNTIGYFGDIAVDWSVDNPVATNASTNPMPGSITSDFYSGHFGGTATWWANDLAGNMDSVVFTVITPGVDTIEIVDSPGTGINLIGPLTMDVGKTKIGYAAGFNNTIGYVMDVSATWQVIQGPENATTDPGPVTMSNFWSGWIGGIVDWEADFGGITDTVTVTINPPGVDYIEIVDTLGTGLTPISDQTLVINVTLEGYAASFNNTLGYIGDIVVDWSVDNSGSAASTFPLNDDNSTFSAGGSQGQAFWNATDGSGNTDSVIIDITPWSTDWIEIVDTPGTGSIPIDPLTLGVGIQVRGYAAAFNTTAGYLGDIIVTWTPNPAGGANSTTSPGVGTWTDFYSGFFGGTATWTADDGTHTDTVTVTIDPPEVNYIEIVDTSGTGATAISPTLTVGVGITIPGYAASFNNTIGYLGDISVAWQVIPSLSEDADTNPVIGLTSDFYSGTIDGSVDWEADDLSGHTYTVTITILPVTVDYIEIVDTAGTGSNIIMDGALAVGVMIKGYAAGFNSSLGTYVMDVSVTWEAIATGGSNASTAPPTGTWSDLYSGFFAGSVDWTATYLPGITDTVTFTINPPTLDYILIVSDPGVGTTVITDQTVLLDEIVYGWAAGFNNVIGYIYDVSVTWSVNNILSIPQAVTNPTTGINSTFDSKGVAGTSIWMADDGMGHSDSVMFSITDFTIDYIDIVNTGGTGVTPINDQPVNVGYTMTGYAAAFNTTGGGYLGDIAVTWNVWPVAGEDATTTPAGGTSSVFDSKTIPGTVNWSADDGNGHLDWVIITINPLTIDYIRIVDISDVEIPTQTVNVGYTLPGYAAGYNTTSGWVMDVPADWTVMPSLGGGADSTPTNGTISDFYSGTISGSVTWQAEYGGMTDTVSITISPPTVDDIEIVDSAGTGVIIIADQPVGVGLLIRGYAAGFNITIAQYVIDVSVTWTATPSGGSNASTTPSPGTWSDCYSGFFGGSVDWMADYGSGITDTVVFTIDPPIVNYIEIVDTAGTGGALIPNQAVNVGIPIMGYAASFNNTIGYIGDVSANWDVTPTGSEDAVSLPTPQTYSNFFSGNVSGSVDWEAEYNTMTYTVTITINMIVLNYIEIVDTGSIGMTTIPDQTVDVGVTITGFAAAFNYTIGYIGDVDADWSVTPSGTENASTDTPGTTADFSSGTIGGSVDWEAEYNTMTYTVTITINAPTVDYITIVDTADIGTTEIPDQTVSLDIALTGYAASFNNTANYIGDITASWTVTPTVSEDATTTPGSGESSGFDSGTVGGSVTWTADDLSGHTDTVVFTISPPTIDYIEIVDTSGTGTTTVADQSVNVGITITGYAAAFNNTAGYVMDVDADWSVTPAGTEDASTDAGPATTADFSSGTIDGSVDWEADYNGMTYTVTITINPPLVDSIKIMDAADNAGSEVTTLALNDDETEVLFAAGFNATTGYVEDVDADWSTDLGTVAPATVSSTTTYTPAPGTGTGTLTATYMGFSADVDLSVDDVTGPPQPGQLTVSEEKGKVVITPPSGLPTDVAELQIQRREGETGDWVDVGSRLDPSTASYTDEDVQAGKTYHYRVVAYDDTGNPSTPSPSVEVKIPDKEEELPWILLLLIIIIVIIIILLLLFLMTRKKEEEEEMPLEEAPAPGMPEEEMPFEEEGLGVAAVAPPPPGEAAEEGAPEARLCPNCGGAMEFIEDYDQHYCYTCGKYDSEFEDEGGEGGDEMPEGEGEPPSEGPSDEEPPQGDEEPSGDEQPREDEGGPESEENPPEY